MALPCPAYSAPISISQIRSELGTSNGSLRYLSNLAGKGTPDAMSEFYCYTPAPSSYSYPFSSSGSSNMTTACGYYFGLSLYSSSSSLISGITLYSDSLLTTPFNGGNLYRKGQNNSIYRISTTGVITVIVPC